MKLVPKLAMVGWQPMARAGTSLLADVDSAGLPHPFGVRNDEVGGSAYTTTSSRDLQGRGDPESHQCLCRLWGWEDW